MAPVFAKDPAETVSQMEPIIEMSNLYQLEIDTAYRFLNAPSGTVVVPTDTTYGIICRLDHALAVDKIYEIKGRDRSKPLIILGSKSNDLWTWAKGDLAIAKRLAEKFWPGPLTIVVVASEIVPKDILSGGTTVGLRVPDHLSTRALLSKMPNGVVASTSANLSGLGVPQSFAQVVESMEGKVDYVMPDCGESPKGTESTIVDLSSGQARVLREGELSSKLILQYV